MGSYDGRYGSKLVNNWNVPSDLFANMAQHSSILDCPSELLIHIFREPVLEYTDICRLSTVCSKLNEIAKSNDVWKAKFISR